MVLTRVSIASGGTYLVSSSSFRIYDGESSLGSGVTVNADADSNADSNDNNNNVGFISGDAGDDANDNNSKTSTDIEDTLLETVRLSSSSNSRYFISKRRSDAAAAAVAADADDTSYIRPSSISLFSRSSSFWFILYGSLNELDPSFGNGGLSTATSSSFVSL